MIGTTDYWVVRCDPRKTLLLAEELRVLGFTVWAPIAEREYRKARSKKYERVAEPMLPSFIFVLAGDNPKRCAERLDDLRFLIGIRVMRENGHYAGTSAISLDPLRAIEHEAATFGFDNMVKNDTYAIGDTGSINALSFMGLSCTIVGRSRGALIVLIDNMTTPITIKTALFCPSTK
jgi:hypothetical protein